MYTAQDIADELRDKKDDLTYSADELEQIEERLDTLHKLKRKYGGSVEDVIAFCEKAKRQLDEVEFASDRIEQLQKKLSALQTAMQEKGMALSAGAENGSRKITGGNFFRADAAGYAENSVCLRVFRAQPAGKRPRRRPFPDVC